MHARRSLIVSTLLLLPLSACVKKSTHQATLLDLSRANAESDTLRMRIEDLEDHQAELMSDLAAQRELETRLRVEIVALEGDLQRAEARRRELDVLLSDRGAEYRQLENRLEALRAVEQEVRERNQIFEDMIGRFQSLIDGGRLNVAIVRGRMVLQLPQDILFGSGSATLGRDGRAVIEEIGTVLSELADRRFQVEGHTDNVPIATPQFPSNWELSSARALAVVRLLIQSGVVPENVSGAAYGEYQPIASNEDRDNRRLNRRIEIVMLPNLDVIAATQSPG